MKKQMKKQTKKTTTAVALTDDQAANAIRQQYQVVIQAEAATFRERVRFGGMLLQWERFLGESRGGKGGTAGEGLKGWLERNCPEIGYSAARGYKTMAERAIKMLGGGAVVTAALLGNDQVTQPDGEVIDVPVEESRKCDAFFEKADSRRKLEQMWFEFVAEEGRDGARPSRAAKPLPKLSRQNEAKAIWNGVMVALSKSSVRDAIPLLGEKETQVCHDGLMDLLSLLKKHLKEF